MNLYTYPCVEVTKCSSKIYIWCTTVRDGRFAVKCSEIWSERAPDLSHLGPIWPTLEPKLAPLVWIVRSPRVTDSLRTSRLPSLSDEWKSDLIQYLAFRITQLRSRTNLQWSILTGLPPLVTDLHASSCEGTVEIIYYLLHIIILCVKHFVLPILNI